MAIRKVMELTDNQIEKRSWLYEFDAEADLSGDIPADCSIAFVCVPDANKSQFRMRKTDGTFVEVKA